MKMWWQSKTMWLALLQAVIGIATLVVGIVSGNTQLNAVGSIVILKSLLDIYVRFLTDMGILKQLTP